LSCSHQKRQTRECRFDNAESPRHSSSLATASRIENQNLTEHNIRKKRKKKKKKEGEKQNNPKPKQKKKQNQTQQTKKKKKKKKN